MSDKTRKNTQEAEKERYEKPRIEKKGDLKETTGGTLAPVS
jgi:hypothetical protein